MKKIAILFAAMAFAAIVFAQNKGTQPTPAQIAANHVAHLTQMLSLTSDQQASATAIFTSEETALASLRDNTKTAREALETAIEANDSGGISTAATEIGTLTTQEVQTRGQADAALWAILTTDQRTKFKQLRQPGGFGPPNGPGGPPPPDRE